MKTIRTTMAVALMALALTAFQSDALAQTRRGGTSRSASTSRSTSTSTPKSSKSSTSSSTTRGSGVKKSTTRPKSSSVSDRKSGSAATRQPSTTVTRPEGKSTHSTTGTITRPVQTETVRPTSKPETVRPSTKPEASTPSVKPETSTPVTVTRPARPADRKPGGADIRPDTPVQIRPDHKHDGPRVHPRDRDFMHYNTPSYFWTGHNHCYGHRIRVLPTHAHVHVHYGVTYYCYNDIWYRPYGGYYVVCRPPFGTVLASNLVADMTWATIRFSYYNTVAQTYSQINENNEYIAQQNAIIAQNNATIAAQNAQIAAGQQQAQIAYSLANQLGLIQSYAAAGSTYYYQDGVFYSMDATGQYSVIVPPAGALVETLPEDYDMVVLADGNEYYQVDDTIYRVSIVEGKPYFEVLGQRYY